MHFYSIFDIAPTQQTDQESPCVTQLLLTGQGILPNQPFSQPDENDGKIMKLAEGLCAGLSEGYNDSFHITTGQDGSTCVWLIPPLILVLESQLWQSCLCYATYLLIRSRTYTGVCLQFIPLQASPVQRTASIPHFAVAASCAAEARMRDGQSGRTYAAKTIEFMRRCIQVHT